MKPDCQPSFRQTSARLWTRLLLAALTLSLVSPAYAQFFPGQGGGGNRSRSGSQRQYNTSGTVGDAVISIDPETRSLVVIADDETSRYISQVVSNLDIARPQVLIKVVFLEVNHNDGSDIGIEGQWKANTGTYASGLVTNYTVANNQIVPSSITPGTANSSVAGKNLLGLANPAFTSLPNNAGLFQILGEDYEVTLRAIAVAGKAKVLSRPSVIARNNQPATITVGQSVPLITNVRFDNFGNAINSVSYTDVGIILRVTPFITGDGMVEMIVSPETSDLVQDRNQWVPISTTADGTTVSAPVINSRTADTVVVTPNGQTVIIGGLMQNSKSETVTKIPYIGDIPLLGALFRRTIKTDNKTELLIFLTPYIIDAPKHIAAVSEKETDKFGALKGLTEEELNKFLEGVPVNTNAPPSNGKSPKKKN